MAPTAGCAGAGAARHRARRHRPVRRAAARPGPHLGRQPGGRLPGIRPDAGGHGPGGHRRGAVAPRRAGRRRRLSAVLYRARRPPRCRVGSRPRGQCPRDPGGSHAGAGRPDRAGRAGPADDRAAGRFRSLSRSLIRSGSPTDTPPLPTAQERHVPYR
ncbi:hypothetical protein G6F57_021860 [Rhizopus arrhizus]|nr:hypothetical protein G6F57_021860 [Rhizopus arrhizus]